MKHKGLFATTIFIVMIFALTLSMTKFQLASARPTFGGLCSDCHAIDQNTLISVTLHGQTATNATYLVSGSDNYNSPEGWAVFNSTNNNIANGTGAGNFTIPKNDLDFSVYWVDDADDDQTAPDPGKGGSAVYTFTVIPEFQSITVFLVLAAATTIAFLLARKKLPSVH